MTVAGSVPERHRGHAAIERLAGQAHAEASFTLPALTDYDVIERLLCQTPVHFDAICRQKLAVCNERTG